MSEFLKPTIRINFESEEGNIFYILAGAYKAMKIYKLPGYNLKIAEMKNRVTNSQDYDEALKIIKEYVNILSEENWI